MLEVIGAGLGRTGTHSLGEALEILGFGPCYTILDVDRNSRHIELWSRALVGEKIEWKALYSDYRAAVDWPTVSFLPEILGEFAESKVVLTLRDSSSWYESAAATIFPGLEATAFHPDPVQRARSELKRRLILDEMFEGRYRDREHAISLYEHHIETVINLVPEDRLLQYEVAEGWNKLCEFLEVEVPDRQFPHRNRRGEFIESAPDWAKDRMVRAQKNSSSGSG
jgi:hypothetical protein